MSPGPAPPIAVPRAFSVDPGDSLERVVVYLPPGSRGELAAFVAARGGYVALGRPGRPKVGSDALMLRCEGYRRDRLAWSEVARRERIAAPTLRALYSRWLRSKGAAPSVPPSGGP